MNPGIARRHLLASGLGLMASSALPGRVLAADERLHRAARMRVIVDNDFGGDPDGLFQLAHFAMSRSMAIPFLVGSQYKDFGAADLIPDKAQRSAEMARELLKFVAGRGSIPVFTGSPLPLASRTDRLDSPASEHIVREAMRSDATQPLFYAAGGSLTELARAWLREPAIGSRLRLVWIGGAEHTDLAVPPPGPVEAEYNFTLDRLAAQIVFNESNIEIWQVPRNAFRQMLFSLSELDVLARSSPLANFLQRQVNSAGRKLSANLPKFIYDEGETIMLGDCALVTVTALQSAFQPDSTTSSYALRKTPFLQHDGSYRPNPDGRTMRVYNAIDAGLTWRDFMAKLRQR